MSAAQLTQWQWDGYPRYHGARANLLIHIFAVPLFWAGSLMLFASLWRASAARAGMGLLSMVFAMVLQGRGHKLERVAPEPFTGFGNAVARLLLEQWVTFPRFVFSGQWFRALREAEFLG